MHPGYLKNHSHEFFAVIHAKHLPAILYLLVALAKNFECPFKLPNNVVLNVVVVQVCFFLFYISWLLVYLFVA